jgi:predicted  nucleic acid-binding Zn-ribbon protein
MRSHARNCNKCGKFVWWIDNEVQKIGCDHCGASYDYSPDNDKNFYINVRDSFVTSDITGKPIHITSSRDEERICADNGVARYNDYRETFKNSKQKQALREHIDGRGIETQFGRLSDERFRRKIGIAV